MGKQNVWNYYDTITSGMSKEVPEMNSWELIVKNNAGNSEKVAFADEKRKIYYGQLPDEMKKYARAFSALDISGNKKSRVLNLTPNLLESGVMNYSLDMTGAVNDYVDPTSKYETLTRYIENEGITDIVTLDLIYLQDLKKHLDELKAKYGIKNIVTFDSKAANVILPRRLRRLLSIGTKLPNFDKGVVRIEDAIRNSRYQAIDYRDYDRDEIRLVTHTSGTTTGIGKPVPLTDYNRNALYYQHVLAGLTFTPGMRMLHFIPYFAAYGAVNTAHLGLSCGMEMFQIPYYRPEDFGRYLIDYRPNIVIGNNSAWLSLLDDPLVQNADLSFLNIAITGGSPITPKEEEDINKFLISHGAKCILTKGHGLSELGGCGSYTIDGYNEIGNMGVPLPLTKYAVKDVNDGKLHTEEGVELVGEAYISSPNLTPGYLDGKEVVHTEVIDGVRYLPSKDIIRKKEDGSLYFVERKDRMFPRFDGYNVYPQHVENLVMALPFIQDCHMGKYYENSRNGCMPILYFVPREGYTNFEQLIRDTIEEYFIKSKDNKYYKANFRDIPQRWVLVESLPKNTMGKTDFYRINKDGLEGIEYEVIMDLDNMGVNSFEVKKKTPNKQLSLKN